MPAKTPKEMDAMREYQRQQSLHDRVEFWLDAINAHLLRRGTPLTLKTGSEFPSFKLDAWREYPSGEVVESIRGELEAKGWGFAVRVQGSFRSGLLWPDFVIWNPSVESEPKEQQHGKVTVEPTREASGPLAWARRAWRRLLHLDVG